MDPVRIDPRLESWTQVAFADQINLGAEHGLEPVADLSKVEQRNPPAGIKRDGHIDIGISPPKRKGAPGGAPPIL